MRKCYLLVHNVLAAPQEQMKVVLNSLKEVITWRTDLPNAFYLVSEEDASTLTKLIRSKTGEKGRFLITEIGENRNGWLTPESWKIIKSKQLNVTG